MSLPPGAAIGIIGGGQLGRMLALAALQLGFRVHVLAPPEADNVAFAAAHVAVAAPYEDGAAMRAFASAVDVVTYEFENVPVSALDPVTVPVRPGRMALAASQDRAAEKAFLAACGLPVARNVAVSGPEDLDRVRAAIPHGILKTRRFGYDGKGQTRIGPGTSSAAAFAEIGEAPAILEETVDFVAETSVVLVRSGCGEVAAYPSATNTHEDGILRRTAFPAPLAPESEQTARDLAARVAEALDYVGVLAVEFFVTDDPRRPLIANEMAPRVHNTGHWTQDGAVTCQFENHIRAIAGWPLGAADRTADVTMVNLLGEEAGTLPEHLHNRAARAHLYGKTAARPGRKMGHINFLARTVDFDADRC